MAAQHLLLVDDSEAIIRFEQAALGGRYRTSIATNGLEALEKVTQINPDLVLLDLSMPQMDGDEVLRRMQADEALRSIPVVIVSSEEDRARQCLSAGAVAYLPKPIRADKLNEVVEAALESVRQRQRRGSLAVLWMNTGGLRIGVALEGVVGVYEMPATQPLPSAPAYVSEFFILRGRPVLVLDLARRLGREHLAELVERKLVVIRDGDVWVALSVDTVSTPEEYPEAAVLPASTLGGTEHGMLAELLQALVKTREATLPVLRPRALLARSLLRDLAAALPTLAEAPPQKVRT